ncbi:MAG: hypothetical protein JXB88_09140 [Spirochaetales bacterium]|nr:hypothetical protein [Spirochaetales bacterium]
MNEPKIFLITGNEDLRNRNLFIENLLYHQKLKGENSLLINHVYGYFPFTEKLVKMDKKQKKCPVFDYYTDMEIPVINFKQLQSELKRKSIPDVFEMEHDFSNIFLFGELGKEYLHLYQCIDHIILIVKNEYETSSYVYNFINKLYEKLIDKSINIIISNIQKIEDAATLYLKLRDEMHEMIEGSLVIDFLGFLDMDVKKIAFTRRKKKLYIRIFFEDAFHGNIKYINQRLSGLEYFKVASLFKSIAENQE